MENLNKILRIDTSARVSDSVSRGLVDAIIEHLSAEKAVQVEKRDVSKGLPFINEDWVGANFTPPEMRTDAQASTLAQSDQLVNEIKNADTLVIGIPTYNFGVPATFKAWVDLIGRAGVTFKYTETGPVGLMEGKRAIIALASGGTPSGSEIDFVTPYVRHILGFIGITDVTFIIADAMGQQAEEKIAAAMASIKQI
ncbi:FMN-dependent NADH-azoreductase [Hirschia baltica]|uniref:FMN dependent NADH:quinone oxidoreductase n=1 Tax=Hirschia baltica (strain ATCC 49814 / DSM 5838 / IFAM 1418) TaxID=582402 RepID=C6XQZ1_HIRBI|nr:NAD(P)H dehydrogenase (quinone) [Hirschia baltica ATCC 49814]